MDTVYIKWHRTSWSRLVDRLQHDGARDLEINWSHVSLSILVHAGWGLPDPKFLFSSSGLSLYWPLLPCPYVVVKLSLWIGSGCGILPVCDSVYQSSSDNAPGYLANMNFLTWYDMIWTKFLFHVSILMRGYIYEYQTSSWKFLFGYYLIQVEYKYCDK